MNKIEPIITTLCFVLKENKILLGMKKKGFGQGRWNGFGGKVEKGEKIVQAAQRELLEESELKAAELEKIGKLDFYFPNDDLGIIVHVFICDKYQGVPGETDEMAPRWFGFKKIPFNQMWPDDIYWFSHLLERKKFEGKFVFKDFDKIIDSEVRLV